MRPRLHRNLAGGWTLRDRARPVGAPSLSWFPRLGPWSWHCPTVKVFPAEAGGHALLLVTPAGTLRLHLMRQRRNVLWGARRGDRVLGRRSGIEVAMHGMPPGTQLHVRELVRDACWLWIPVFA